MGPALSKGDSGGADVVLPRVLGGRAALSLQTVQIFARAIGQLKLCFI